MELVPETKTNTLKLRQALSQYFVGMLLMPWIWAFGLLILEFVLISYYNFQPKNVINEFNLLQIFSSKVELDKVFLTVALFVLGNYTITFATRKSYPRLSPLLFYLSLFSLCILFTFIWPYFLTVLGGE